MRFLIQILFPMLAWGVFSPAILAESIPPATGTVSFSGGTRSDEFEFTVPEGTRAITIMAEGEHDALFALSSLVLSDGREQVGLLANAEERMGRLYFSEEVSFAPSSLMQTMRLGTFVLNFPFLESQSLPAGLAKLAVVTNKIGAEPVAVKVFFSDVELGNTVRINLMSYSNSFRASSSSRVVTEANRILRQAGIRIRVVSTANVSGSVFSRLTDFNEPQETPVSQAARLALDGGRRSHNDGLNVFVVDELSALGISLGIPGPPVPGHYYFGVVIKTTGSTSAMGRTLAHEVCHFLGLQHVSNRGLSGAVFEDAFDDTSAGDLRNLMSQGTFLSPKQIFALRKSPLVARE